MLAGCKVMMWVSVLVAGSAQAGQYWVSSNGMPIRDTAGTCVEQGYSSDALQPGCDPMDRVILLPDSDGKVGAVQVRAGAGGPQTIDAAYGAAHVEGSGALETGQSSTEEVSSRFGQLLEQQPLPPEYFTLRFQSGSATELTPDSEAVIQQLFASLDRHSAAEIRIVGHTDSVGSMQANDRLSRQRARTVAEILTTKGIPLDMMEVAGRGERELAVETGDGVDEERNRRVEVVVR